MTPAPSTLLTVERGMKVLRAFRADRQPLSNTELVRRTGLSKATVSRLTTTLLQVGFIRHVPGGREFELAGGPTTLGQAMLAANELAAAAGPHLDELAESLGVSAAIAISDGIEMLYVAYRASRKVVGLRMGVGSVLPMGFTAVGHAYLWSVGEERRRTLLDAICRDAGTRAADVRAAVGRSFAQLEERGACAVMGMFQRGAFGVALPVRVGRNRAQLSISGGKVDLKPDVGAELERITPALMRLARRLQESLAHVDVPGGRE